MKPPFFLVPDLVSTDTVECCRLLNSQAKSGELIGLAFVGLLKRRSYIVNTAGELHRNPTFARGCLLALDDQLALRIMGGNL